MHQQWHTWHPIEEEAKDVCVGSPKKLGSSTLVTTRTTTRITPNTFEVQGAGLRRFDKFQFHAHQGFTQIDGIAPPMLSFGHNSCHFCQLPTPPVFGCLLRPLIYWQMVLLPYTMKDYHVSINKIQCTEFVS